MIPLKTRTFFARALLVAAVVWLASVTLCSTRAVAALLANNDAEEAGVACCQEQSAPEAASAQGDRRDEGCGCKAFKVFLANPMAMAHAPAAGPALYDLGQGEFTFEPSRAANASTNTGPPRCLSPAELILQGGHFSHAPPWMA